LARGLGAMGASAGAGGSMSDNTIKVILLALVVLIYMLPTLIAFGREHTARHIIVLVNILLGWTLIGWIVVFLWALLGNVEDDQLA